MRLRGPDHLLLANMQEHIDEGVGEYLPKEQAYEIAKRWTGQDFGYDTDLWWAWFEDNRGKLDMDAFIAAHRAVRGTRSPEEDLEVNGPADDPD